VTGKIHWKTLGTLPKMSGELAQTEYHRFLLSLGTEHLPVPTCTLAEFVTKIYFPEIEQDRRGNTLRGYRGIWKSLPASVKALPIQTVRTPHIQQALRGLADNLGYNSIQRVRSFLTQVFACAIRNGYYDAENPVRETRNPRRRNVAQTAAYDLATIQAILNALPLTTKAVCAVASFAGLRRGEIFGLQWQDWKDGILHVNRQVAFDEKGRMIVQEPKTMASKDAVPVIPALAEILQEWKNAAKHSQGCWMFPADFVRGGEHTLMLKDALGRTPLSPANFVRDQVEPILEKANISWRGFHAFRRGLATNLHALGVQDIDIQQILRHSDVAVTRASYIKGLPETAQVTMGVFGAAWAKLRQEAAGQA
jgi:integrase